MKYEELSTGWLAPDGSFFECHSYDHVAKAEEIIDKFGYLDISSDGERIHADDNLMSRGWCYIGISSFMCHEWRIGWDKFLTEYQKQFLMPYFKESYLPVNELSIMRWEQETEF